VRVLTGSHRCFTGHGTSWYTFACEHSQEVCSLEAHAGPLPEFSREGFWPITLLVFMSCQRTEGSGCC
jgi:hypothetical protein